MTAVCLPRADARALKRLVRSVPMPSAAASATGRRLSGRTFLRPRCDRHHRRLLRPRALGLAQRDPLRHARGDPGLWQRQHGRVSRRRAGPVRHGRRRRIFEAYRTGPRTVRRAVRGRRRSRGTARPPETRLSRALRALVNVRCTLASATRSASSIHAPAIVWSARARPCSIRSARTTPILGRARAGAAAAHANACAPGCPRQGRSEARRCDRDAARAAMRTRLKPVDGGARYTLAETTLWEQAKAAFDLDRVPPRRAGARRAAPAGAGYLAARGQALDRLLHPDRAQDDDRAGDPVALVAAAR